MPTYVYKCLKCNIQDDRVIRISELDKDPQMCHTCNKEMKRLPSAVGISIVAPHPAREGRGRG